MPLRVVLAVATLFMPIVQTFNAYGDVNAKKLTFSLYLFGFIRLIGGYVTTYKGGAAVHISKKKAILLPYSGMNDERKKFSFVRTFRLLSLSATTETGAEYLLYTGAFHVALKTYLAFTGRAKKSKTDLWLTDGDALKISVRLVFFFTAAGLTYTFFKFLIKSAARRLKQGWKKKEKSTV
ncbi:MAG: hypothetical protein ACI4SH_07915, partial [Candidatus Scatosoma sp.]